MKNKILLPILLLAAMSMVACNPGNGGSSQQQGSSETSQVSSEEQQSSSEQGTSSEQQSSSSAQQSSSQSSSSSSTITYGVAINNKTALTSRWFMGTQRTLDIALTPAANALQEIQKKNLVITSSNTEVVSVSGITLNGLKDGQSTITVSYHGVTDTVDAVVLPNSAKAKYEVEHEGTAEDPFTNEDAVKVANSKEYEKEEYYVRGEIAAYYHTPGERSDGTVSWFLKPAQPGGAQFEIYKCIGKDADGKDVKLTDDDVWPGGIATARGTFTLYNGQAETTSAVFVSCTGTKPAPRAVVEKPFDQVLEIGLGLQDGDSYWDYLKFQGYVSAKTGDDYWLTATKGEAIANDKSNAIELYGAGKVAALNAKLLEGAKVEVTMAIKNYHNVVENVFALKDENVTVLEAGTAWNIPEPDVVNKTVTEFVGLQNTKAKAYNVTATIKAFKNADAKDKYGNMTISDGTTDLAIYGSSATQTALAWDKSSSYAFTNPQDFLTNTTTQALAVGNTITMKLIRADYKDNSTGKTTIQGTGVITNVVAVATTAIALDSATAELEVGKKLTLTATRTPENSNTPCEWISSDDTVATVAGGVVTAVGAGTATITAKISDEIKAECALTVTAPEKQLVTLENVGTGVATDYVTEETEYAIGAYTLAYNGAKKQGDSILLNKDKSAYLLNKTAMPGAIKAVTVYTNNGASATCKYAVAFSATPFTARTEGSNATVIEGGSSADFACSVQNALYFCITVSVKNGQVLKVVIEY